MHEAVLSAYNQRKDSRRIQRHCLHSHLQHSLWKGTLQNCHLRGVKYGTLCLHAVSMTATRHGQAVHPPDTVGLLGPGSCTPTCRQLPQHEVSRTGSFVPGIGCDRVFSPAISEWFIDAVKFMHFYSLSALGRRQVKCHSDQFVSPSTKRAGWCWQRSCQTGGHNRQR